MDADSIFREGDDDGEGLGPFGPPEAERADIDALASHFVPFDHAHGHSGLGMRTHDLTVRVIVGRKGSGKTLYLRRLRAAAASKDDLYVDDYRLSAPRTAEVVRVCHWYHGAINPEIWSRIWRVAIVRAVLSHVLCSKELASRSSPETTMYEMDLRDEYPHLYGDFGVPLSIDSQLSEVIGEHANAKSLERYIYNADWERAEQKLASLLKELRPLCFYIDGLDKVYRSAPRYWMMCQLGLFDQVMELLSDQRFGGKLHLIISIRDHVFSRLQGTEHALKYIESPYIRLLDWNLDNIKYFLRMKVANLSSRYLVESGGEGVEAWLGEKSIWNSSRQVEEDLETYLLRHTRLLPRDVVLLGNRLCSHVERAKADNEFKLDADTIRRQVRAIARKCGNEQLEICANHIAADMMPARAAELGFENVYTIEDASVLEGATALHNVLRERLSSILAGVQVDRFGRQRLDSLTRRGREEFDCDLPSILWQNGLLGFISGSRDTGTPIFYHASDEDELAIPRRSAHYVFHPVVAHALGTLRAVGAPVIPTA